MVVLPGELRLSAPNEKINTRKVGLSPETMGMLHARSHKSNRFQGQRLRRSAVIIFKGLLLLFPNLQLNR